MKKSKPPSERLPREAVVFVRKLISGGAYPATFARLTNEYSPETDRVELALLLAILSRLTEDRSYEFLPIALNWQLGPAKSDSLPIKLGNHHNSPFQANRSSQHALDQMQPALKAIKTSVFQVLQKETGMTQLRKLTQYEMPEEPKTAEKYLRDNHTGLGISHAMTVAKEFIVEPYYTNWATGFMEPEAFGHSLFILLDYLTFANFQDKVGTPTLGWWELRVIEKENRPARLLSTVHAALDPLIPRGSLIVVANVSRFKKL